MQRLPQEAGKVLPLHTSTPADYLYSRRKSALVDRWLWLLVSGPAIQARYRAFRSSIHLMRSNTVSFLLQCLERRRPPP